MLYFTRKKESRFLTYFSANGFKLSQELFGKWTISDSCKIYYTAEGLIGDVNPPKKDWKVANGKEPPPIICCSNEESEQFHTDSSFVESIVSEDDSEIIDLIEKYAFYGECQEQPASIFFYCNNRCF